jgi:hypothetical protein
VRRNLLGERRRHHHLTAADEKPVVHGDPQPPKRVRYGRLRRIQFGCGAGNLPVAPYRFEHSNEIEIANIIHEMNIYYFTIRIASTDLQVDTPVTGVSCLERCARARQS